MTAMLAQRRGVMGKRIAFVSDSYTAADSTANQSHTSEVGGAITHHGSSTANALIASNRLRGTVGGTGTCIDYYAVTPPSADYMVTATSVGLTDNNAAAAGFGGRIATGANTGVYARYNTALNQWEIIQISAGTLTTPGTFSSALPSSSGEVCDLILSGTTASLNRAGVQIIAPVTVSVVAAGKVGTCIVGTYGGTIGANLGVHLDNLTAA